MKLWLLITLSILFWGLWGFTGKLATRHNHATVVAFASNVAYAICALVLLIPIKNQGLPINWSGIGMVWILLTSAFGVTAQYFFYSALGESPSSLVVAMTATYPMVTVGLSVLLLGERLSFQQIIGLALAVLGVYLLMSK